MIIAIDPGFGNQKAYDGGHNPVVIPAVITIAHKIGLAGIGMKQANRCQEIRLTLEDGNPIYMVGQGAEAHGAPINGMDYSNLSGESRRILVYASLAAMLPADREYTSDLVIGLPVPLLQNEQEARQVIDTLRDTYKNKTHQFYAGPRGRDAYTFHFENVSVVPQPVGAYAQYIIEQADKGLSVKPGKKDDEVAVIDIGMNTVDLYVIQAGQVAPRFIAGDKIGVRRLFEDMLPGYDIAEIDSQYRSGKFVLKPAAVESWVGNIANLVESAWPNLTRFRKVLAVGGGVKMAETRIFRMLTNRGGRVYISDNPVTANVIGFWLWAAYNKQRKGK